MENAPQSRQAYARGLAILSIPTSLVGFYSPSVGHGWLVILFALTGAVGMYVGAYVAHGLIEDSDSPLERVILSTPIAVGIGFLVASAPYILYFGIGMIVAWIAGVARLGLPVLAITIFWSSFYFTRAPNHTSGGRRQLIIRDVKGLIPTLLVMGLPGVATIAYAVWASELLHWAMGVIVLKH